MAFKLKIKRGASAPTNSILDIGELGYDTDGKKLYIGNGYGTAPTGVSMDEHEHDAGDIISGIFDISLLPTITTTYGGTGITSYTGGELLYASGSNILSKLGIGSTNQILTVVGGMPTWANAGTATQVANSLVLKINTGTTEGTSLYTFNGSAAKTLDIVNGSGISLTAGINSVTIAHSDTSSAANLTANGRTYVTGLTFDTYGHVTGYTTGAETVVNTNTTYSVSAVDGTTGKKIIRLTGSDATTDDITLVQGSNVTLTRTGDEITIASAHPAVSAATSVNNSGRTYIQDVTLDSYGHVTGLVSATETVTDTNTTYSIKAATATGGANLDLDAGGSGSGTDSVKFANGANVTIAYTDANTITISSAHPTISTTTDTTSTASPAFGGTFTAIDGVTRDSNGHVTTLNTKTITLPSGLSITANATDGIFDITGTSGTNAVTYAVAPYATQTSGGFDSSSTTPSGTTRLNWNGYLYATQLYEGTERIATKTYVDSLLGANDAMVYKGTLGTGGTITALSTTYSAGWTYRVITAGTYAGVACEIGDLITAIIDRAGSGNLNTDWTVLQTNLDGAVIGPASAVGNNFAAFDGTTGKLIKDSGYNSGSFATAGHTHAITAITAGNYKVFYSNGSGVITELALGAANTYLKSTGTAAAPTFAQIAYSEISGTPTIGNGALTLTASAGLTNTAVTVSAGTGFTANSTGGSTYDIDVGPALTNLATFMTTATAGFIKRTGQDTYGIDTNSYSLSSHTHTFLNLTDTPADYTTITDTYYNTLIGINSTRTGLVNINSLDCGTW